LWVGSLAGPLAVLATQLGRFDDAERYFAEAEEMNTRIRAPFFVARNRLAWAQMLLQRSAPGDGDRAMELARDALDVAREYDCFAVARDAEALLTAPPPLPARLAAARRTQFVGRDAERAALADSVATGGMLVLVAGEPGIGKSSLAAVVAESSRDKGAWVLYGRSDDDLRVPYLPFIDAMTQLVDAVPDSVLDRIGDRHLAELVRIAPNLRDRRPSLPSPLTTDPDTERYLFMNAVAATLVEASAHAPVVLVVDDLHWADKPSVQLLRHLLSRISGTRVTIIGTYRHTDLTMETPLSEALPELRRDPAVSQRTQEGLSVDEVGEIAGADTQLAEALHRETDGNPFFAAELARHLVETGADLGSTGVPHAVRSLVVQRVGRAGGDLQRVLTLAAVFGQEFDLETLAVVVEQDADALIDTLERAEASALVETIAPERYAFAHALIQRALYDELPPTRRARTHRRIAETILASGTAAARVAEMARHWAEAALTPEDLAIAARYAAEAGDRALDALAPDAAMRWYRQALDFHRRGSDPDDATTCRLLLQLGKAQTGAGDPGFRDTRAAAGELAIRLGDADLVAQAALISYEQGYPETDPRQSALLDTALRMVGDEDSAIRGALLERRAYEYGFSDPDRSAADHDEAMAIARRTGNAERIAGAWASVHWYHHQRDIKLSAMLEALDYAEASGDPATVFTVLHRMFSIPFTTERAGHDHLFEKMVRIADDVGRPDMRWIVLNLTANRELCTGNITRAEQLFEEAHDLGRRVDQPGTETYYAAGIQAVRWHQGRPGDAAAVMMTAAQADPWLPILRLPPTMTDATFDLVTAVQSIPKDGGSVQMAAVLAELIGRAGDVTAAALLHDYMLIFRDLFADGGPMNRGPVRHSLGVVARTLGRLDDAVADFEAAEQMSLTMSFPFFIARARVELAYTFLERGTAGDAKRAHELLEAARAAAAEYGYAQVERRAERALNR
jgi:tetratricopeptide (TPR) repeat protein